MNQNKISSTTADKDGGNAQICADRTGGKIKIKTTTIRQNFESTLFGRIRKLVSNTVRRHVNRGDTMKRRTSDAVQELIKHGHSIVLKVD